jgi:hypothetical protein
VAERPAAELITAAELPTVAAQRPELSMGTGRRREDTLHPAVRAASARAHSATSRRADRQRTIPHAEAPAWVAEHRGVVEQRAVAEEHVAVGGGNRRSVMIMFPVVREI